MRTVFSIGWSVARKLRRTAEEYGGANEAELEAIERLCEGQAKLIDVERLQGLAALAGLPWKELFPELMGYELT